MCYTPYFKTTRQEFLANVTVLQIRVTYLGELARAGDEKVASWSS